jgi:hypothetical protein
MKDEWITLSQDWGCSMESKSSGALLWFIVDRVQRDSGKDDSREHSLLHATRFMVTEIGDIPAL